MGETRDRLRSDIGPFAIVPDWVVRSRISDRALRLYTVLGRYANREGEAFPSRRTLAVELNTSSDSIDRATKELVDLGALTVEPRRDLAGDQTSNLYRLHYADPGGVAAPLRPPPGRDAATGGRTSAATVAAPVRPKTITTGTITTGTITTGTMKKEQRAVARVSSALVKLFHCALDEVEAGLVDELDIWEVVKARAARARLSPHPDHITKAAASARAQRARRQRRA